MPIRGPMLEFLEEPKVTFFFFENEDSSEIIVHFQGSFLDFGVAVLGMKMTKY